MKSIDPEKTEQIIIKFIKQTFEKAEFSSAVIALSGGIDSSVAFALTVIALGKDNVFPVLLPHGELNDQGTADALEIINKFGIPKKNIIQINIKKSVDEIAQNDPAMDMMRKGNIMARVRMTFVFDQAKKRKGLVVGTENKSEHLLGYYTRFGDEASDIEPLRNLYKTEIYQLAKFMHLPTSIITKQPTAGLWKNQTDEKEFGFSYKDADKILYYYFDKKISDDKIIKKGLKKATVEKVLQFAQKNNFKHHLPFTVDI